MELAKEYMRKLADLKIDKDTNTVALLNLYIVSSVLYYEHDISIIQDYEFDFVCKMLYERWHEIHTNPKIRQNHKDLLDRECLTAGSGYTIKQNSLDLVTYGIIQYMASLLKEKHGQAQETIKV